MRIETPAATRVRVRVTGKGETAAEFSCDGGEPILHAGLRAGIDLPYECASGTCGTCKATLVDGEIACAWPDAPGHKSVKPERREFLMCQCTALATLTVAVPRRVEASAAKRIAPRAFRGTVRRVRRLVRDVAAFDVELAEPMHFDAGQFVLVDVDGIAGARAYSMTTFERDVPALSFLVKRFPGGALSAWLFDGAAEGAPVRLFGPLGRATFEPELGHHLCCVAGGSGIAGMMAILAHACAVDYFADRTGDVFFGIRTPDDAFCLEELSAMALAAKGRLRVTVAFSDADATAGTVARYPLLAFARGFVHDAARAACAAMTDTMFFVAGPPPMVDGTLRMLLLDAKVPGGRIRYDKFS